MDTRTRTVAGFGLLAALWGFSFLSIAVGLEALAPLLFAAYRYDVAAVVLLGAALARRADWRPTAANDLAAVAAGGVFLVGANGFLFLGQQTVPSGAAAVMQSLVPIATSVWAVALLPEERVTRVGAVGVLLGFLGVGLVVRPDPANLLAGDVTGRVLILVQVTGAALGGVLVQRAAPTLDRAALSGWSMLLGGGLLHAASALRGEAVTLPVTATSWAAVGYLGVFATGLAFFLYYWLLETRGALETSLVAYLVPVVATAVGVVVLNERLTATTVAGFLVVFLGFVLLKRRALADLAADVSRAVGRGRPD